ncbi:hypothetical protein D3227_37250 [Mesorhizobium waimense]|uniref:Coproporphyrinogen III oxidase n=1 Tax=Mesorhizobium waimense TaxID=1300307 RepID=A0A3A5JU88_9HYPH|nr:hypothetical protein D3227_37250 [Mesorhizobium waimense]
MRTSILTKYHKARLPWYTIYPTVPEFSEAVGAESYKEWLRDLPAGPGPRQNCAARLSRRACFSRTL